MLAVFLYQSVYMTRDAFAALDKMAKSLQANGHVSKDGANGQLGKPQANSHAKKSS